MNSFPSTDSTSDTHSYKKVINELQHLIDREIAQSPWAWTSRPLGDVNLRVHESDLYSTWRAYMIAGSDYGVLSQMEVLCPFFRKSMAELEVMQREVMRGLKGSSRFLCLKQIQK